MYKRNKEFGKKINISIQHRQKEKKKEKELKVKDIEKKAGEEIKERLKNVEKLLENYRLIDKQRDREGKKQEK